MLAAPEQQPHIALETPQKNSGCGRIFPAITTSVQTRLAGASPTRLACLICMAISGNGAGIHFRIIQAISPRSTKSIPGGISGAETGMWRPKLAVRQTAADSPDKASATCWDSVSCEKSSRTRTKRVFNHEPHEKARKFFIGIAALRDGMARGFVICLLVSPTDRSDRSDRSAYRLNALRRRRLTMLNPRL